MASPSKLPVPLLVGVMGETLFLGVVDPDELNKKPEFSPEAAELFQEALFVSGFFDVTAAWNYVRDYVKKEISVPNTFQGSYFTRRLRNDPAMADIAKSILDSDLAVKSVKLWAPTLETSFMEMTLVEVPEEKRLLPQLANLATFTKVRAVDNAEAAKIVSDLRNLKAASLMFYADSMDEVADGKADALIAAEGIKLLLPYLDKTKYDQKPPFIFKVADFKIRDLPKWLVGRDVSNTPSNIRQRLQERAASVGLIDENGALYSGGDIVFMVAR
jgi:hypothetical protein